MKPIQTCGLGFAAALAITVAAAEPARPDLAGRVANPNGSPITNATILIYTAAQKAGDFEPLPLLLRRLPQAGRRRPKRRV